MAGPAKKLKSLARGIAETSNEATDIAKRICEDIRGDILRMSRDLKVESSAADRRKVEEQVKARLARMNRELAEVMENSLKLAQEHANLDSGQLVAFSPKYAREILSMVRESQGENLASVYSRKMAQSVIEALRRATVSTIQEAALSGLSLREQKNLLREKWEVACKDLGEASFVDSGGRTWEPRDYFTMNVRTNAMRVYNDVLAANITADGDDLAQITRHGDPFCKGCFPWEGRIVSLTGKTKGFPTYEQARLAGCFHPNCTHTLQTVDEIADADEIELQKGMPTPGKDGDPMKDAFDLDVKRKQSRGMGKDEAEASVRRERLTAAIRNGIPVEKSTEIVEALTDGEVAALTDGYRRIPKFSIAKKHEKAKFTDGSAGGHVILARDGATAESIIELVGDKPSKPKQPSRTDAMEKEPSFAQSPITWERLQSRQIEMAERLHNVMEGMFAPDEFEHSYGEIEGIGAYAIGEAYNNGDLGMYIPYDRMRQVMRGRFKSLHETGTSGGTTDKEERKNVTRKVFGVSSEELKDLPEWEFEKYGLLLDKDSSKDFEGLYGAEDYGLLSNSEGTAQGGRVCVRFKKSSVRATFTVGDSLDCCMGAEYGDCLTASRFDNPKLTSFTGSFSEDLDYIKVLDREGAEGFKGITPSGLIEKLEVPGYIETQYHGRLGVEAIESINFESWEDEREFTRQFKSIIEKHGIKVYGPNSGAK